MTTDKMSSFPSLPAGSYVFQMSSRANSSCSHADLISTRHLYVKGYMFVLGLVTNRLRKPPDSEYRLGESTALHEALLCSIINLIVTRRTYVPSPLWLSTHLPWGSPAADVHPSYLKAQSTRAMGTWMISKAGERIDEIYGIFFSFEPSIHTIHALPSCVFIIKILIWIVNPSSRSIMAKAAACRFQGAAGRP